MAKYLMVCNQFMNSKPIANSKVLIAELLRDRSKKTCLLKLICGKKVLKSFFVIETKNAVGEGGI